MLQFVLNPERRKSLEHIKSVTREEESSGLDVWEKGYLDETAVKRFYSHREEDDDTCFYGLDYVDFSKPSMTVTDCFLLHEQKDYIYCHNECKYRLELCDYLSKNS